MSPFIVDRIRDYEASEKAWDIKQRQLEEVTKERDELRAESNGKHWQGIAQIAALQTENATLKAEVERLAGFWNHEKENRDFQRKRAEKAEAERNEWRDKAMFQQGRADEAIKIAKDMK